MSAIGKFVLAAAILIVAVWLWPGHIGKSIDKPQAQVRASEMLQTYIAHTGEQPSHFGAKAIVDYPDGWEFSWVYVPCPATARLRIFVHRSGSADYGETPDCHPVRGFGVAPQVA